MCSLPPDMLSHHVINSCLMLTCRDSYKEMINRFKRPWKSEGKLVDQLVWTNTRNGIELTLVPEHASSESISISVYYKDRCVFGTVANELSILSHKKDFKAFSNCLYELILKNSESAKLTLRELVDSKQLWHNTPKGIRLSKMYTYLPGVPHLKSIVFCKGPALKEQGWDKLVALDQCIGSFGAHQADYINETKSLRMIYNIPVWGMAKYIYDPRCYLRFNIELGVLGLCFDKPGDTLATYTFEDYTVYVAQSFMRKASICLLAYR